MTASSDPPVLGPPALGPPGARLAGHDLPGSGDEPGDGAALPKAPPHAPGAPRFQTPRFQTPRTVAALILREMGSTYGRSPGGYAWTVLEPLGAILLLSVAFALVLRAPSLGTSFLLFYATGYMPFSLYQDLQAKLSNALRYSKSLLAYPRVTWLDAVVGRLTLNLLTNITVACLLFAGILTFVETRAILSLGPILAGMSMAAVMGTGMGLMNCLLGGLYPVWLRIYAILARPLFLASGIFYLYEDLPQLAQDILWFNPLFHATGLMREGFYPTYHASYVSPVFGFGTGLVLILFALIFLRSHHKRVLEG